MSPVNENVRETTPEPSDPLVDLTYLESCVKSIIASDTMLRDLVEAYNTLATRIRSCVLGNTDADASWPLFQPIRQNREAFVDALVRDLGRALEDPSEKSKKETEPEEDCAMVIAEEARLESFKGLPSPKESPKKKRKGMSAERIKHARDLSTTSQAVLRLLSAAFTMPAIYQLFSGVSCHSTTYVCRIAKHHSRATTTLHLDPCTRHTPSELSAHTQRA